MSSRLNKSLRSQIRHNAAQWHGTLVAARVKAPTTAEVEDEFREALYQRLVPNDVAEKLQMLPPQFVHRRTEFAVYIDGSHKLTVHTGEDRVMPVPQDRWSGVVLRLASDDELAIALNMRLTEGETARDIQRQLDDMVRRMVNNEASVGALLSACPRLREFIPEWSRPKFSRSRPAPQTIEFAARHGKLIDALAEYGSSLL